ncbi:hypothetical protein FB565_000144 [Actinoplanes lutulentus]|nr:hypothetical protein [Actinoplanes lutulentus]MBB2940440.1 hypothetical protein [Actinoplanes lutulentus]
MKGELTPDELDLLHLAQEEVLSGVTFDVEAGLADLRERVLLADAAASSGGVRAGLVTRGRSARLKFGVSGFVAVITALAAGGLGVASMQAGSEVREVRVPAVPSAPGRPLPVVSASSPAPRPSPSARTSVSVSFRTAPGPAAGSPSHSARPAPKPAVPIPSLPPVPAPTNFPSLPSTAGSPAPSEPEPFPVRYAAYSLTMALSDDQSQSIDLEEPRTVASGDGAVAISAIPDTTDLLLEPTADVQAAAIAAAVIIPDVASPDECAAAIRDDSTGDAPLELRDDRTYCLLTPVRPVGGEPDQQTLVQLTMDPANGDAGKVTVHLTAWDLAPG